MLSCKSRPTTLSSMATLGGPCVNAPRKWQACVAASVMHLHRPKQQQHHSHREKNAQRCHGTLLSTARPSLPSAVCLGAAWSRQLDTGGYGSFISRKPRWQVDHLSVSVPGDPLVALCDNKPYLMPAQIAIWVLSGTSLLFLASRFAIRIATKGRLMVNDYFLVIALPALWVAAGLLHTTIEYLLAGLPSSSENAPSIAPRLTIAIDMLWVAIYSVKLCFLAQFKFHKPPYAYVSVHLTRYYWFCIAFTGLSFAVSIAEPIIVCPSAGKR
jgi:hypothetical protein